MMEQRGKTNNTNTNNKNNNNTNTNNNNNNKNNKKEKCITMHQPWASLLVHGIKRIEGRSWPSPLTGRLWIHAASKVPGNDTIKAMEKFYRVIYARDGIIDLEFPSIYPVSRLVGCIDVVGCVRRNELACWKEVPEGVRLEALTDFCWLCEHPQLLSVPLQMGGWKGVYDLDSKINEASIGTLIQAENPLPFKFPLPNPEDPSSLRPGSLCPHVLIPELERSADLSAIIDAASQAATQFSNKGQNFKSNSFDKNTGILKRPDDGRFMRYNQYNGNHNINNRDRINSSMPVATQYVKKQQDTEREGFHTSSNSLPNNLSTECRIENEEKRNDHRCTPQINEAAKGSLLQAESTSLEPKREIFPESKSTMIAKQLSNNGESYNNNNSEYRNKVKFTRPEDDRFVRNNQYTGNNRFNTRDQRYIYRPVATQYVKKEHNTENNGLHSRDQRDFRMPKSTNGVQSAEISGTENVEICTNHRATPQIFAAAVKGIRPLPHTN